MTDKELLARYIPLVDFIADICGKNYEVLLHDISKPEASVIAIRNGHHSGRTIGSPMTDLALKVLKSGEYKTRDYIANYTGTNGNKQYYSSTFYIKNGDRLLGMLCINNDMAPLMNLKEALQIFVNSSELGQKSNAETYSENISNSVSSLAESIISRSIDNFHVSPKRMSRQEKMELVQHLNEQGVLLLKGAVAEIAAQLCISEVTVYRYARKK